jgi:threonine/homoserine/homoserine lactone efflux protein
MTELLPLLTYSFLMSSTPGPNNVMLTASGARFGYRRTVPHILGIAAGHAPQTYLSCVGLGALFAEWPLLHDVLRWAGAAWLVWIALRMLRTTTGSANPQRPMRLQEAMAFQMVNPKGWVKALTTASVFMPAGLDVATGAALVTAISIAVNLPCVSMWALFGAAIGRWLGDTRRRRAFDVIMATTLIVLALTLVA